jgi:predicted secreted protein
MSITSAIVFYCVIWAIVFFMVNPLWQTSQSEDGKVISGTPASAPVDPMLRKKVILTTVLASVLFALAICTLAFGWLTLDDISFLKLPSQGG